MSGNLTEKSMPPIATLADLLDRLGRIAPRRVRFDPVPGTATEKDLIAIARRDDHLFELVDKTLVEKAVGYRESILACALIRSLLTFVKAHDLGQITGPDGSFHLFSGIVRAPDVAFISWSKLPGREIPANPFPRLAPDLAIEVLSPSNTKKELARKRREYFKAGVELVWEIDPVKRQAVIYTSPNDAEVLDDNGSLSGGSVLPGFLLSLRELFADLD